MCRHGSQWFSHKMNNRHPLQLKKSKSWEPFGSYQLNSTANPAHLPQNRPNFEVNGLDWQCCLAGSSQRAPRIFIFSIVLGAENLSYVKSIETHARAFLPLDISAVSSVRCNRATDNFNTLFAFYFFIGPACICSSLIPISKFSSKTSYLQRVLDF